MTIIQVVLMVLGLITVGVLIGIVVLRFLDWLDDRKATTHASVASEKQRIVMETLRIKSQLDAQAFAARQALNNAAMKSQRDSR
jgi:hypothetical protein